MHKFLSYFMFTFEPCHVCYSFFLHMRQRLVFNFSVKKYCWIQIYIYNNFYMSN